jgi:GNAT superfamily N-acetyltransferase
VRIAAEQPGQDEVLDLYASVGWTAYTNDPDRLVRSLSGSHTVLTARAEDGALLGVARTVSDGETICYLQDLLVRPDAQRRGIGRQLVRELLRRYRHCRSFVLSTDPAGSAEAATSHPFYRSLGFVPYEEQGLAAFGLAARQA